MSNQSSGFSGQRFAVFLATLAAMNFTMWWATRINAAEALAGDVIMWECIIGGTLVLGRSAVYVSQAMAAARKK